MCLQLCKLLSKNALTDVRYVWAVLTAALCCRPVGPSNPKPYEFDVTVGAHDLRPHDTSTQRVGLKVQGASVNVTEAKRMRLASVINYDAIR